MKVVLKLTKEQSLRARQIAARNDAAKGEDDEVWAGNLLGWQHDHQSFNSDQCLEVEGSTLQYVGQRCPFWADGASVVLFFVLIGRQPEQGEDLKGVFSLARVADYETSDARLEWWETLDTYLRNRAPLCEVLEALKMGKLEAQWVNLDRLKLRRPVDLVSNGNVALASAELTRDEMRAANLIAAQLVAAPL